MSREPLPRAYELNLRTALAVVLASATSAPLARAEGDVAVPPSALKLVKSQSGPTNYYSVVNEDGRSFVRSRYAPPSKTAVLGWQVPEADRKSFRKLRWTWRAQTLPKGGDECAKGKGDSAAVVYVTWKSGLRYYTLKYVWSSVGAKGKICDQKRNPFVAQDTVIVDSGPPLGAWRSVEIDLDREYRDHFERGDAAAEVPPFVGIGIMSDGDQTESPSSADFGAFTLSRG